MKTLSLNLPPVEVIGPYSQWPRKPRNRAKVAAIVAGTAGLAVALHCGLPLLVA